MSDLIIRHAIYRFFVDECRAPSADDIAYRLRLTPDEIRSAFRRLHEKHMIYLNADTHDIRMANPFSAIPTGYRVHSAGKTWWANCAWDTLGIAAALNIDVDIEAIHPANSQTLSLAVKQGEVTHPDWIVYFPLPCRRCYDNLVFT